MNQKAQMAVCLKYGAPFIPPTLDSVVGVSVNVTQPNLWPLNGLRHPPEGRTCGWYIWRGENFSNDAAFFKPVKLLELLPKVADLDRYLALAPGWRFLFAPGSEDVWSDQGLLDV